MKQILYYYYNLDFDIELEVEDKFILKNKNDLYILKRLEIDEKLLQQIIHILNNYHILFHNIVLNVKNELISSYKNKEYVLLRVDKRLENNWIDFNILEVDYHLIDIGSLWEQKIDYYIQIMKDDVQKDIYFLSIFNYYIGMSENAISIVNRIKNNSINLKRVISHKRIKYPFDYIEYFDPTEMIIDYRIRDYSEYLKSKVLKKDVLVKEEIKYILLSNFTNDEINVLIARLLYPSYFWDFIDNWIETSKKKDEILKFIEIIRKYESFLNDMIENLSINYNIYQIDWIKK